LLCHERDKDLVLEGASRKDGTVAVNPLGIELDGCPLDEKISEMHALRKPVTRRRARARRDRQPDVPRHRPPHLQRLHEVVHLSETGAGQHPADRTGVLHRRARPAVGRRDLRPAHALESAERPRPFALPYNGKNVWSSDSARPATHSRTTSSTKASASSASTA
jgi:hypothetical protein